MIIGVIGPHDLVPVVAEVARSEQGLEVLEAAYGHEREVAELMAVHGNSVDAWLCTGIVPYRMTDGGRTRPARYVDYSQVPLLEALLRAVRERPELRSVSIDTLGSDSLETVAAAGFPEEAIAVRPYRRASDERGFADFHAATHRDDPERSIALTCLASVHAELTRRGVPSIRLVPSRASILEAVRMLVLETTSSLDADAGVVIVAVESDASGAPHDALVRRIADRLAGTVATIDGMETIVSTRGLVLQLTAQLTSFDELPADGSPRARIGIGWGSSATESFRLAKRALSRAATHDASAAVVATRATTMLLEQHGASDETSDSVDAPAVIARRTGLSIETLDRIRAAAASIDEPITTQALAAALAVQPRTARRWLTSLEHGGYASKVGQLHDGHAGRPFSTFDLRI